MIEFLPISPRAFLIQFDDLTRTLAAYGALKAVALPDIAEIIPAARTLMVRTVPGVVADGNLAARILSHLPEDGRTVAQVAGEVIEIPMTYDGKDLDDVARLMGLSVAEVKQAHQAATWQVAFCGFAPGFAYMSGDDPRFNLPRRAEPRTRIPAGSVALAAQFCGIYPKDTPGGWQLIGQTNVTLWDLSRKQPALLRPGMRARFVSGTATVHPVAALPAQQGIPALTVLSTAFPIHYQDEGRPGHAEQGVSASGALDMSALRRANRAVGNPSGAAALEITLGPVRLLAEQAVTLALSGAGMAVVAGRDMTPGAAFALDVGDEVTIPLPDAGMRSYLALRGGFAVQAVLGSRATDTLASVGPGPVLAGAVLGQDDLPAVAVSAPEPAPALPRNGDVIALAVNMGPRTDWFQPDVIRDFLEQEWRVTPQSSRVGIRLQGERPLLRSDARELPSEGTELGAIQVPHSGQPVLFLADHPLTGGYPVIATLAPEAVNLAGQIPPGARIRFTTGAAFSHITPTRSA